MNGKKRILFVDDEALVLQGLQRILRPMRGEWETDFREGGGQALEAMAARSYDVLVSDMRMPGMNGAELLNETMRRHPGTVRIILSGHADRELILQAAGAAHQYLSKPCDRDVLIGTVRRALELQELLQSEVLRALVTRMRSLPSAPALYTEILACLRNPETTLENVSAIVARDVGMSAAILKLVNSAFFGLPHRVGSIADAIARIGLETLRSLVFSIEIFEQFRGWPGSLDVEAVWGHSLKVAIAARAIAEAESAAEMAEEAFIAGLLHDAGKLILAANFDEAYKGCVAEARLEPAGLCAREARAFGTAHAEVGAYLIGLWGLPMAVVEAIALHHAPGRSRIGRFSPLAAVHAADFFVHEQDGSPGAAPLDEDYLRRIDCADRLPAWREAA